MKYVVSGGAGFIGKNLGLREGDNSMCLDLVFGCDLVRMDISLQSCRTFIHLAAITDVRQSLLHPTKYIHQNSTMTLKCLELARNLGSKFVYTSSMNAPQSFSPYLASKLACEAYCTAYRRSYGLETAILRLSNVYGPHSAHKTSVVAKFIKACIDREPITIYGNGKQTRDFIYVGDVVDIIYSCSQFVGFEMIRIGSGIATSIWSLAMHIQALSSKLLGYEPEVVHRQSVKGEVDEVKPETDIVAKFSLDEGLERTFKWFMEHYAAK